LFDYAKLAETVAYAEVEKYDFLFPHLALDE
jgi:hypothetical protein